MDLSPLYAAPPARSFWFGILCTLSLPIGALLGIWLKPGKRITAAFMAFGAGALLSALALELVVPAFEHTGFWPLAAGSVSGGLVFIILNQLLNGTGAFLRKPATFMRHLVSDKRNEIRHMVSHLAKIEIFRDLPPAEIKALIPYVRARLFDPGTLIFRQGDAGNSLYLIDQGEVEVSRDGHAVARLKDGEAFGEMALLSGEKRNATLTTVTRVSAWQIMKEDFDRLVLVSPKLFEAVRALSEKRLAHHLDVESWRSQVVRYVNTLAIPITDRDMKEAAAKQGRSGAAFAIWLGLLLDGIPESAVVGASMAQATVSWALIAGLFISNMPEAMSSSVGMRAQNKGIGQILWMWMSIVLISGAGSLFGNLFFAGASPVMFSGFEGCAAGAMLVVIAETMLPEAYEQGGAVVGISTLLGFLAGLFVKSLGA